MLCLEVYAIFQTLEILNQDSHLRGCHKSGNLFIRIEEAFKVPPEVGAERLELTTSRMWTVRSNQLSYAPWAKLIIAKYAQIGKVIEEVLWGIIKHWQILEEGCNKWI